MPVVNPLTGLAALIVVYVSSAQGYFEVKCLKTRGGLFVTEPGTFGNVRLFGFEIVVRRSGVALAVLLQDARRGRVIARHCLTGPARPPNVVGGGVVL